MPGIAGIISAHQPADLCRRQVQLMTTSMVHEPFHRSGTHSFEELGIYGGWVAHADSPAAGQVFWNERRDVALLLAGECFLDDGMARSLRQAGHEFADVDGGWIVHAYEEQGEQVFPALNGLFSGLLVDLRQCRAFVFNDRYGSERLYWHRKNDAVYFASEAKALLRGLPELRAFDDVGLAEYLNFGCTREERTLFRGLQLAPGGSLWRVQDGECQFGRYFEPSAWECVEPLSEAQFDERFHELFPRILRRYCAGGSRLGLSLTGGLDTRMILAGLPDDVGRPLTYTFAALDGQPLDATIARKVATAAGLRHEVIRLEKDFFKGFGEQADRTVFLTDGCFTALGAHEVYWHRKARAMACIRLTGNYGSEVLRSMSTFKRNPPQPGLLTGDLAQRVECLGRESAEISARHPVTFAAFQEVPWNLFGCLAAGRSQMMFRTPYLDNELVALAYAAPVSARTSPDAAVRFVQRSHPTLGAIPTDRGLAGRGMAPVRRMRRLWADVSFKLDYHCSEGLPRGLAWLDDFYLWGNRLAGLAGQHKFLQYRRWLQHELSGFARERVAAVDLPFIDRRFVAGLVAAHVSGRRNFTREINLVATLGAVERQLLSAPSVLNP